jgi:DNA polymerase-3 subunit delta
MDINGFRQSLKDGSFRGVYIFGGEEQYLVKYYLGELRRAAVGEDTGLGVFNNPVFDGESIDFGAIVEAVKAPPMMSDYKLIEWRHADFTSLKEKEVEMLEQLAALVAEYPYSIVAFTATADGLDVGGARRPSKFYQRFSKTLNIFNFEKSTETQLYSWLKKHFDSERVEVTLDVLRELVFRSGRSMEVLVREVGKLSALAHARGKTALTVDDVVEVASQTPESDTFALSNAVTERNKAKAYAALEDMKYRRVDTTVVMAMLARTFDELLNVAIMLAEGMDAKEIETVLGLHPNRTRHVVTAAKRYSAERLREIVSTLSRTDADSKFGGVTGYTAVELFISQYI